MLILTRRVGETVLIGDNVEVTVLAINGLQARIGIKAPRDVIIDREEIAARKRRDLCGMAVIEDPAMAPGTARIVSNAP